MSGISRFISKLFWLMIFILFGLLIATLVASNTQLTTLQLWPIQGELTVALWLPILLAFCAGLIIGGLLVWLKSIAFYDVAGQMQKQKKNNVSIEPVIEDDSHLLFDQTATDPPSNSEKSKQTLSIFTQGS